MRRFFNLIKLAVYLGLGLAVQVYLYADLPSRALVDGSVPLSVYAHILVWPLFVVLELIRYGFWIFVGLVIIVLGFVAYIWAADSWKMRRGRV